jgi:RsiW-degrading membrane proteinase PrsW (M82 family)
MNRNVLYAVIGALAVVVLVLGYMYYQEQQKPSGVDTGPWEIIIGMEVHAQVSSKSKLFSGASTEFGAEPN